MHSEGDPLLDASGSAVTGREAEGYASQSGSGKKSYSESKPFAACRDFFTLLPVIYLILIVAVVYSIFIGYHCIPLLQLDRLESEKDISQLNWGIADLSILNTYFFLLVVCYIRVISTPPGTIPDTPEWNFVLPGGSDVQAGATTAVVEMKRSGERRHCKWCSRYKPDRAHHCRVCRQCVLKMDHHCPWVYNCVGYGNHKFFILLVFYSTISAHYVAWRMVSSVQKAVDNPMTPLGKLFLLLLAEMLTIMLAVFTTGFLLFHLRLIIKGETTIEFCEKNFRLVHPLRLFSKGVMGNLRDAFGPNPLMWFMPIDNREGDGVHFTVENVPQTSNNARPAPKGRRK